MLFCRRGIEIEHYPAIKSHLEKYRESLEPKPKEFSGKWNGRKPGAYKWYEIQDSIDYWKLFESAKIIYQEIQFHPSYSYDEDRFFSNNKGFILPTNDLFVLAILNSPIAWWYNWRYLPHMKDEALTPKGELIEQFPIAPPTDEIRAEVEPAVQKLIEFTKANQQATREMLDWFRVEHGIEKAGNKLSDFATLSLDDFLQEVKKRRPKGAGNLGPKDLKTLKEAYGDYALPIQQRRRDGLVLEHRISDLINQAYGLTPEDIDLMWKTAPPRMPFSHLKTS